MTLLRPTDPITTTRPAMIHPGTDDFAARVLREGSQARLDEVLHDVVVNALGPDARVAVSRDEWLRIEDVIRGPVAAAAAAALERLAAEVDATLPRRLPELSRRVGSYRLRAELGYD